MAEPGRGGEPTEPPSEKKLRDARRKGDVPRSRDLVSCAVFAALTGVLLWRWPVMQGQLQRLLRDLLRLDLKQVAAEPQAPLAALQQGLGCLTLVCAPLLAVACVAALLAGYVQVGSVLSLHPVRPQLARLDPVKNAKQVLGKAALYELLKSALKLVGIGWIGVATIVEQLPRILATGGRSPLAAAEVVTGALSTVALRVLAFVALLALGDLVVQRLRYRKRMMMTRSEAQREQKEQEGDPQRKAERRRLHQESLEHQMLEAVAQADCVIINPEHVAVALRYDEQRMAAPRVVARGRRRMAAKIREIARQNGIPLVRNVPLARALVDLELDQEIPVELYEAVAEVLRFVYRLSRAK